MGLRFKITDNSPLNFSIENLGEEPVITATNGNVSVTIGSGTYAGTYTQRVTDSATLTVSLIETAEAAGTGVPLVLPTITGDAIENLALTGTPGLWIFSGEPPGEQTFSWVNNTDGATGETDLDYTLVASDVGDTIKLTETFGSASIDSANTATVVVGNPIPSPFADANWSVATGPTTTPNSLTITIASLPALNSATITDIQYEVDASGVWTGLGTTTTGDTDIELPLSETSYDIRLRCLTDANEVSSAGNTETATSGAGVPDQITDWSAATGTGGGAVDITIGTAPDDNGAALTAIQWRADGGTWASTGLTAAGSATVTLPFPATFYDITVRAVNAVGNGAESAPDTVESGTGTPYNPESGLTLTDSVAVGANMVNGTSFNGAQPQVWAMDFTGLVAAEGRILEQGGNTTNGLVYFDSNNDFVVTAGANGSTAISANGAYLIVPNASAPSGDGTLVVEMTPGTNTVRAWWNGSVLGSPVARASGTGNWGADNGAYLAQNGTAPSRYGTTAVSYTTASALRCYVNQTVT